MGEGAIGRKVRTYKKGAGRADPLAIKRNTREREAGKWVVCLLLSCQFRDSLNLGGDDLQVFNLAGAHLRTLRTNQ
ncbi:hypothetical protein KSZ_18330 [Dictyobacter formicarum]|uniref:Uncharacterized protein n=1 Tax=Dictyobacter formicarum TaxID=2778368 RepID=A0ABQ3VD43_9CHLR|nr:hypothetical protein KSZ_18330 [Dictyobacter formicarum]